MSRPAVALLATLLANLLTNLSATLLLVPMLAPLGTTAVLAALLGLNIGSGLTYTGSLANLLWRRTLVRGPSRWRRRRQRRRPAGRSTRHGWRRPSTARSTSSSRS